MTTTEEIRRYIDAEIERLESHKQKDLYLRALTNGRIFALREVAEMIDAGNELSI